MPPVWKLNSAQMLALACLGAALGSWLKRKIPLLDRVDIPVPIVGGMVFALVSLGLHGRVANVEADTSLRDLLMIAFMTTIGLSARVELLRKGGGQVAVLLAIASVGALLQNVLGIGLAKALGIDARFGILTGSVALAGGPATAAAFGDTFEKMGVHGATTVALASATFGIAIAGLIGGYIGARLAGRKARVAEVGVAAAAGESASGFSLLSAVIVIGICVGVGNVLSTAIQKTGVILPAYIGAMIVGAAVRNCDDAFGFARISQAGVDACGKVALYLFIVMALVTLRLWELASLALPMIAILAAQVAFCWAMCVTLCYRAMGRNYEAAVMSAGFCGFMLGITANAVACMEELVEKFGPAPQAFLVVPIVGAFLIDFTNSLIITGMANWMR